MSQAVRPLEGERQPLKRPAPSAPDSRLQARWQRARSQLSAMMAPLGIGVAAHLGVLVLAASLAYATRQPLVRLLTAWDSRWYLKAASSGYPHHLLPGSGNSAQSTLGFFPALPLLVRFVHWVLGTGYVASGLTVSSVLSLSAPVAVWAALRDIRGHDAAVRGTAMVFFSPGAFVLAMVYSEGFLITTMALCLVALRRRHWLAAGLLAGAASATDPLGLAAFVPCAVVSWQALGRKEGLRPLLAPLVAPAGVVGFFSFLWAWTGTPFAWLITQRRGWEGGALFAGIPTAWSYVLEHGFHDINDTVKAVSVVVILGLVVLFLRSRPDPAEVAYVVATLVLAAASPIVSWTPRVALRAFPLLGVVGARAPRNALVAVVGFSAVLLAGLAAMSWARVPVPFTP